MNVRMSEAFEWLSTTTTSARPLWICMYAFARPWIPSPPTVCIGRRTAPSWSGVNSSKIPKPS